MDAPQISIALRCIVFALLCATLSCAGAQTQGPGTSTEATLPAPVLATIAFGSCANQDAPQPIWDVISHHEPELFLFIGDNVYGNVTLDDPNLPQLRAAYAKLAAIAPFQRFRDRFELLPIWDDHDYGANDGGIDFPLKDHSKAIFTEFWKIPPGDPRMHRDGLYRAWTVGPPGQRVQIIFLDTRYFRTALLPTDDPKAPGKERYIPTDDPGQNMLGDIQWKWLQDKLKDPAEVRLVVSSIQILAEDHGYESWNLMPLERKRLVSLIGATGARGVVLLSGDRHMGGLYRHDDGPYPLYELTSSSMNRPSNLPTAAPGLPQIGHTYRDENYGLVHIDWPGESIAIELRDLRGEIILQKTLKLSTLTAL